MILIALLLCVQAHAITFGPVSSVGMHWQMEMIEAGPAWRPRRGPAAVSLTLRAGQFQDESAFLAKPRGFVAGATVAWRTRMHQIAEYGIDDKRTTGIGLDMTFELTGYTTGQRPDNFPRRWLAASALGGLGVGSGRYTHAAILLGPTVGPGSKVRALLALRIEVPI